jgi:two-component system NtrC family response regulator
MIIPEDLEIFYQEEEDDFFELSKAMGKFEKEFLARALRRTSGNITKAASQSGISRPKMYEMIEKYKIEL